MEDTAGVMTVSIWDEDTFANDLNCEGSIPLTQVCVVGGTDQWHELQHEGKTVGKLHLVTAWTPSTM